MAICIPAAGGVPGSSGEPPYWLPGHPSYSQNTSLDDPRWRGAYRRSLPVGMAQEAVFRALYDVEGGTKVLYLSWRAFVPDIDDADDVLWVGFRPGAGDSMVIRVKPHGDESPHTADPVDAITVFTGSAGGGAVWPTATEPTWIAGNTRMWVEPGAGTSGHYTVQMRVPLAGASLLDNAGPNLGDAFGLWFVLRGGGGGSTLVKVAESPDLGTGQLSLNQAKFPAASSWEDVSTDASSPICPTTGGIDIEYVDIGTMNSPSSEIRYTADTTTPISTRPVNTFFARPRNYTGSPIPATTLTARFRIANWGSVASGGTWENIPGGGGVQNTADIPAHTPGSTPSPTTPEPVSFDWRLDNTDIANFVTAKTRHQCVLVELNGPYTFFNESVYRNMDFVAASTFRRDAELSIAGLAPISGGGPARDVYLAIETINMPARAEPRPQEPEPQLRSRAGEGAGSAAELKRRTALAKQGGMPASEIERFMPTYRVHVYHDTGERVPQGAVQRPVLEPQSSFGYYVEHEGPLEGWRNEIQAPPAAQLQEIAPDFYKVVVPNDGSVRITTVITAVEPQGCPFTLVEVVRRLLSRLLGS